MYKAITDVKQEETNRSTISPGNADSPLLVIESWTGNHPT